MLENSHISPLNQEEIPTTDRIVHDYEGRGGILSHESKFGSDPLEGKSTALIRDRLFSHQFNFELIFHSLVNRDDSLLRKVIIAFIDLTVRLTNQ